MLGIGKKRKDDAQATDGEASSATQKKVDKKAGKKADKAAKKTRKPRDNERLSSVLRESEPNTAIDLLRRNEEFEIPSGNAWIVMLLRAEDIGGLSKKERKNEDKGAIINLMSSDDMNVIFIPELADEDSVVFVPNTGTLGRMDEFGLLREARYLPAAVFIDPEGGGLTITTVPGVNEDIARGRIFDNFVRVAQGRDELSSIVDPLLVQGIYEIYSEEDLLPAERDDALNDITVSLRDCIREHVKNKSYPSTLDFMQAMGFELGDLDAAGYYDQDESDEYDDADDEYDEYLTDEEEAYVADATSPEASQSYDGVDAAVSGDGAAHPVSQMMDESGEQIGEQATEQTAPPVADANPVDPSVDPFSGPVSDPTMYAPPAGGSMMAPQQATLSAEQIQELLAQQREMLEEVLDRNQTKYPHINNSAQSNLPVSDRLDNDTVNDTILRVYENESLGISATLDDFNRLFYNAPPQINFAPYASQTPWLNDQLTELVSTLNDQLRTIYEQNRSAMRDSYATMVNAGVADIARSLDVNNSESPYYELYTAIEHDQNRAREKQSRIIHERREEINERYEKDKADYVRARTGSLEEEYDRRNRSVKNHELDKAESTVKGEIETLRRVSMRKLNERRRQEAQVRYDLIVSSTLEQLAPTHQTLVGQEQQALNNAIAEVKNYLEAHAKEDIYQAQVWADKLEKDNRYENYVSETNARISQIRAEADSEMDRARRELDQVKINFQRDMDERHAYWEEANKREQDRAAKAEADAEDARLRFERRSEEQKEDFDAQIRTALEVNAQKDYDLNQFITNNRYDKWANMGWMVIIAIVCSISFFILGGVVLG